MALSFEYDPEARRLLVEVSGAVTVDDLREAVSLAGKHAETQGLDAILFDQSRVTRVDLSPDEIRAMAEVTRGLESVQGVRMANVAPEDVTFGMSRMYELVRADGENVRTFRSRDAALRWLSTPRTR